MGLLEKVRLLKKKEEKPEEEPPAEEHKPREDWGHQGWHRGGPSSPALGEFLGPRQATRSSPRDGWMGINERGGVERGVREEACWRRGPKVGAAQCVCWNSVVHGCQSRGIHPTSGWGNSCTTVASMYLWLFFVFPLFLGESDNYAEGLGKQS